MTDEPSRGFLRDNALSLTFLLLFALAVVGQSLSGVADYNAQMTAAGLAPIDLWRYLTSSSFAVDLAENWQSEYLQFTLFILLTVVLVQRGSPESKAPGTEGGEPDHVEQVGASAQPDSPRLARAGGWRSSLYGNSLGILMAVIFLLSWLAQAISGAVSYSAERLRSLQDPLSVPQYVMSADFWNRTLQNWQSEFLAVASMVVFAIYLRQRGSSQSKPVGESHEAND